MLKMTDPSFSRRHQQPVRPEAIPLPIGALRRESISSVSLQQTSTLAYILALARFLFSLFL
jgi:hypothetical protein